MKSLLLQAATLLGYGLGGAALAQPSPPHVATLRVTGTALVAAKPDRAEIDVGVLTQAGEAGAAATENAAHLQAVLAALRKTLGEHADIKTMSYGLAPNYRYSPAGGDATITGYTASNVVRVTLDDLQKTGEAIDAATHSGANRVQDIRFTLRDGQPSRLQALRQAATQARSEADALAAALGLKIIRVLSIEEAGGTVQPVRPLALARARVEAAAVPTPIESGTLDVSATVTLTVEIGP
jgi:uncharacterized protein YggE